MFVKTIPQRERELIGLNNKKTQIVLGIDPGTALCGYGIICQQSGGFEALAYGSIETTKDLAMPKRLETIFLGLSELVNTYNPGILSIERLFFNQNVTTAISVGQARGVCLLVAAMHDLEVYEYTPGEIKLSLTGHGKAPKHQVGYMVKTLLNLEKIPTPDDTADALAIALCYFFRCRNYYDALRG